MRNRKWFIRLTKENDTENGPYVYDFNDIYNIFVVRYARVAMVIEIGTETEKEHAHILLQNYNAIRFETLKKLCPYGDIEPQRGTVQECIDYMSKDNEVRSNVPMMEFEDGDIQGHRSDLEAIYLGLSSGMSTYDIISKEPKLILQVDKIERARQLVMTEKYRDVCRPELKDNVIYVCGQTGVGKTSKIYETHGMSNVYRITDYDHPFDNYNAQSVIVFEEFRSSLKIGNMLNYLDIYPLQLPSRYNNKVACYTTVYIVSNWILGLQYNEVQLNYKHSWEAFLRRISRVRVYTGINEYKDVSVRDGL